MTRFLAYSTWCGLTLLTLAGCRSPLEQLIRGQSPPAPPVGYATQSVSYPDHDGNVVYDGEFLGGNPSYACEDGKCRTGTHSHGWLFHHKPHGYHVHNFFYAPPQGMVYPPANQPTGLWFYPYYTLKGPDDFFYTGK